MKDDAELSESLIDVRDTGQVLIDRPIFNQQKLDEGFGTRSRPQGSIKASFKKAFSKIAVSKACGKNLLYSIFPFISMLRTYNIKSDLPNDVVSGLTVGIMHIPQGMAYGMLTGLAPVYGLYTSFFPVIVYFFFGSSRHVSMGTFAVACLMVGSAVDKGVDIFGPTLLRDCNDTVLSIREVNGTNISLPISSGLCKSELKQREEDLKLEVAMAVTMLVGIMQLAMGIAKLGFITIYLSDPLVSGFTTGAACHVFTSQIKYVFGVKTDKYNGAFKLLLTYRDFFKNLPQTNPVTLIVSVLCMIFLYVIKTYVNANPKLKGKLIMPVPVELIVVVLGTVIGYGADLYGSFKVAIIGDIPVGMPVPTPPNFSMLPDLIADCFAISIVVFAISVSMGKILANKNDYEIDSNQELVANAISNIIGSFFSSFVSSASLSRSLVQENVGGKTQVVSLVSSALLLLVLLLLAPYFKTLPQCVLAAIIIIALQGMFRQFYELPRLWKLSKIDFIIWVVSCAATVILDVDIGLMVGVVVGILTIVYRVQRPYACVLGQIPETDIYRDVRVYKEAIEFPRIKIYRFENAIFFVSVEHFRNTLYKLTVNPRVLKKSISKAKLKAANLKKKAEQELATRTENGSMDLSPVDSVAINIPEVPFKIVILDCSTMSFIDTMGVKALTSVVKEYRDVEIEILLAFCKSGVREMFEKTGFFDILDREKLFPTIHDAVMHALRVTRKEKLNGELVEDMPPQNGHISEISETSSTDDGIPNPASDDEKL